MADSTDYSSLVKSAPKYASVTPIGKLYVRNIRRFTWLEWVYIVLVSFSIMGVFSMSIKSLVDFSNATNTSDCVSQCVNDSTAHIVRGGCQSCHSWTCRADFIFAVLLLVNLVFCAYYTFDGLFRERGFETLAYVLGIVAVLVYVIYNYFDYKGTGGTAAFKLIRLVLVCIFAPPNIVMAVVVWWRMGRLNFATVGSNQTLLQAYKIRSLFVTLVVFNVELMASVTTLAYVRRSTFLNEEEEYILPVVLCLTILLAVLTIITVSYEWWKVMSLYYPLSLVSTVYYMFKIVNVATNFQYYRCTPDQFSTPAYGSYESVATVLLLACGLGTVAYFGILPAAVLTHRNFGKGLKEKMPPPLSLNGHHF